MDPFSWICQREAPNTSGGEEFRLHLRIPKLWKFKYPIIFGKVFPIPVDTFNLKTSVCSIVGFTGWLKWELCKGGKFCSVNFSPADAAESPKNRNWTKREKTKQNTNTVLKCILYKAKKTFLFMRRRAKYQLLEVFVPRLGDGGRGVPERTKENNYPNPLTVCSIKRSLIS